MYVQGIPYSDGTYSVQLAIVKLIFGEGVGLLNFVCSYMYVRSLYIHVHVVPVHVHVQMYNISLQAALNLIFKKKTFLSVNITRCKDNNRLYIHVGLHFRV